jgi:hypothetical protein
MYIAITTNGSSVWGGSKPRLAQQICAKGQLRNRYVTVSSTSDATQL